jgi:hypothetical protein
MHKNATKCNETLSKWCKNKHGALKIIDTLETYQVPNWTVKLHQHRAATSNNFLAPLPGKKKTSAKGVSHAHPLLCFKFFFYFIFTCFVLSKTQKNSFLYSRFYFLPLVLLE